jgi:hypothetical protein
MPGCFLIYFSSRRRALHVFLLPGIVFAILHWVAVRALFAGAETWDTALLVLMNLVVDGLAVAFLAMGLYPMAPRFAKKYYPAVYMAGVVLMVGLTVTEVIANNRHRGSFAGQLASRDPAVRIAAAQTLAETGYTGALPALSAALHDDSEAKVRMWAAQALGKSESRNAAGPLRDALKDGNEDVLQATVEALKNLWDKRSEPLPIPALTRLVDREGVDRGKQAAARILEFAGGDEAETALIRGLHRGDVAIVAAAYAFYVRRGEKGSEPLLVQALRQHGTEEMAESLLNSGNTVLADAAREWAQEHEYKIAAKSGRAKDRKDKLPV